MTNPSFMNGIPELLILRLLETREMYGYEIAKAMTLEDESGEGEPLFKQGAIYPVLRSLAASGLLDSRVEVSEVGPPRRYYRITKDGRTALAEWLVDGHDVTPPPPDPGAERAVKVAALG